MQRVILLIGFLSLIICMPAAASEDIAVEDLSKPANTLDEAAASEQTAAPIDQSADSDGDGVPDVRDICPNSPRVAGTYDIGEMFALEDVEFRYMGITETGARLIQTTNIGQEEGGNETCLLSPAAGNATASCLIPGLPEIEIVLNGEIGNKIHLLIRYRVDEKGCPSQM